MEAAAGRGWLDRGRLLRGPVEPGSGDPVASAIEDLVDWFTTFCATAPAIVVLDDLHAADELSVRLWYRLARLAERMPLLVIGAMRLGQDRGALAGVAQAGGGVAGGRSECGP